MILALRADQNLLAIPSERARTAQDKSDLLVAEVTRITMTALDDYRLLRRSGLRVSALSLATMRFGSGWGWGADTPAAKARGA